MGAILLTEEQAAAALEVCTRTLRKERQAGNLHYIQIGRAIRYAPEDLASFVERMREAATPEITRKKGKASANRKSGNIVPFSARDRKRP